MIELGLEFAYLTHGISKEINDVGLCIVMLSLYCLGIGGYDLWMRFSLKDTDVPIGSILR